MADMVVVVAVLVLTARINILMCLVVLWHTMPILASISAISQKINKKLFSSKVVVEVWETGISALLQIKLLDMLNLANLA